MSIGHLIFARYLSGLAAEEIEEELDLPQGKAKLWIMIVQMELKEVYREQD